MDDDFDPSLYTRAPKLDVAGGVGLSIQLLAAIPAEPPAPVKKAAKRLRKAVLGLQGAWRARDRVEKQTDPRPVDTMADGAMGRLFRRIEDYAALPPDLYPFAPRAQALLETLFPGGDLSFLKDDYVSQWAETQKRLDRIAEENLAVDIDAVAGPEFLAEVRRIHAIYGQVTGMSKARAQVEVPSLAEPLREVSAAITAYAIQLVAIHTDADADEATRKAVRAALRPMDEYRAGAARRSAKKEGEAKKKAEGSEVTPETAVPEVPK